MPRNASGIYTLPETSFVPITIIESAKVNSDFADIATALTQSLATTGVSNMTGQLKAADGAVTAPSITFASDLNTGIYHAAADEIRLATNGIDAMKWDATQKTFVLGSFDAAGTVTIGAFTTFNADTAIRKFTTDGNAPAVNFQKSRNAVIGGQTIVQNGDFTGFIAFDGSDGVAFKRSAEIFTVIDGVPGVNDMPGAIVFATTPDGAAATVERMAVRADGAVVIPNRASPLIAFAAAGFTELTEISTPSAPVANKLRTYALDVGGATKLAGEDSAGVVTVYGPGELIAIIEDNKAQNTVGQTLNSGSDQVRELNTLVYNRDSLVSLATNRFTLPAGTWEIQWEAPFAVNGTIGGVTRNHQSFLFNFTDTTEVKRGTSGQLQGSVNNETTYQHSAGSTVVTIAASKAFEIRSRIDQTGVTGLPGNFGTEVYTRVSVRRA